MDKNELRKTIDQRTAHLSRLKKHLDQGRVPLETAKRVAIAILVGFTIDLDAIELSELFQDIYYRRER
jgi:hypothetical protein